MKALVAGWFSFPEMGATAGDLLVRDLVQGWLTQAGYEIDIAMAAPFDEGVSWESASPDDYSHVVFVCGPIGDGPPVRDFLQKFSNCKLVGIDLTMLAPLEEWNPFDILFERDSNLVTRPDLAFGSSVDEAPVVGLVLIHPQPEYGDRDVHQMANEKLEQLAEERACARLRIDTRLDVNSVGLRAPAEVLAMFRAADVVLTTRLHGLVLGLRQGVPVVAIDPVAGGAKVSRQAGALDWPWCFDANVEMADLRHALDQCLLPSARVAARKAAEFGVAEAARVRDGLIKELRAT